MLLPDQDFLSHLVIDQQGLTTLVEVARRLTSRLDLPAVLDAVAEAAADVFKGEIGFRLIEGDDLVRYRATPHARHVMRRERLKIGESISGRVAATGEPIVTADTQADPRAIPEHRTAHRTEHTGALMCVPIRGGSRMLGTLNVYRERGHRFDDDAVALAMSLAAQAGIALENARLFAAEREARAAAETSQHALRQSEAQYRQLVEGTIQGLYIHSEFVIRVANPAMAQIHGYDHPDQMIGMDQWRLIAPHDRPRLEEYAAARRRGEAAPATYEYQGVRRDGRLIWLENRVSMTTWDHHPAYLVSVVDITERKEAEDSLRLSEARLRQSQRIEAIGRLAGGVAHDLNNLLTVITGRTDMLLRLGADNVQLHRQAEIIKTTTEKASTLIRQLLAFGRRQMLQPVVLDVNATVSAMVAILERLISENIHLTFKPGRVLGRVRADRGQLEQVLLNLVLNARDAMPGGGELVIDTANVDVDVSFATLHPDLRPGPHVVLIVSDTGCGMTPETQAHIFEPFFTTKGPEQGTGLGLATVYGIVKQSGGDVGFDSESGRGSTFRVYLPRVNAPVEPMERAVRPARGGIETILLVEDQTEVRWLVEELLHEGGYTVLSAHHPGEALLIGERHPAPIHLLLTDVVMPEMSGHELADRLVACRPHLRVLFMSGHAGPAIAQHGLLATGPGYLQKPFTAETLAQKVRDALDREAA